MFAVTRFDCTVSDSVCMRRSGRERGVSIIGQLMNIDSIVSRIIVRAQ